MQDIQTMFETTIKYLHNLSLRERILVLVVTCGLIFFIGDTLLLSQYDDDIQRMKTEHQNLIAERKALEIEVAKAKTQLVQAKATHQQTKDAVTKTQAALEQKTALIENKLNRLVPPTQITELLRNLLANKKGLKVLSVNNEPVRDISIDIDSDSAGANDGNGDENKTLLYEHAATIKLSGSYQLLYDYLIELENTGWELFWDTLHYRVTSYPNAEITLRVLTISTDKHWIGL